MYNSLDLRYLLFVVINLLKSGESMKWDFFTVVTDQTGLKACLVFVVSLLFSFVSLRVWLISPMVSVQPHTFSPVMLICFLAALILPQLLFWYLYPIICFASATECAASVFANLVHSLQACVLRIPSFVISVTAAHTTNPDVVEQVRDPDLDPDLEMGQATTLANINDA